MIPLEPRGAQRRRQSPWLPRILALFVVLTAFPAVAAERSFYFESINSSQGLAQNSVTVIFQDAQGYMWLGTQGGLHRYDGYRLRRYRHNANRRDSLPDNLVTGLANARDGRLWVATRSGDLVRFDPRRNRTLPARQPWSHLTEGINDLQGGAGGRLWIAGNRGVFVTGPVQRAPRRLWPAAGKLNHDGPVRQLAACANGRHVAITPVALLVLGRRPADTRRIVLDGGSARSVLCRANGSILVGTDHGVLRVDPDSGRQQPLWPLDGHTSPGPVLAMAEDHHKRLWLAVGQLGLVRLGTDDQGQRVLQPHRGVPGSLPEAGIARLFVDRSGLLWVGTVTRGAAYTNPDGTAFRFLFDASAHGDPASANNVRALLQGGDGSYWVGYDGGGLRRFDAGDGHFHDLTAPVAAALHVSATDGVHVYAIARDGPGQRLLATDRGLVRIDTHGDHATHLALGLPADPVNRHHTTVRALLRGADGSWWLGLYGNGLAHYRPGHPLQYFRHHDGDAGSLADDTVVALARDDHGRIWIGTTDGLSLYDPASGRMRTFRERDRRRDSLSGRVVTDIMVGDRGHIWVGTQTGLNRLQGIDAAGAHFRRYLMRDGLPDATIYCIGEDGEHRLWLSTNLGISRLDPASGAVRAFTLRDGLQGMEFNSGVCMRDRQGRLWFGGINGINVVSPTAVAPDRYRPPTLITAVAVGADARAHAPPRDGHVAMPHGARAVRFTFAAMDFAAPAQNRFQYRLVPFERHWIDAGHRNVAAYTNLDAGDYRFEVRGSNQQGLFGGPPASLGLTVVPPWWASTPMRWVYALLAVLGLLAILAVARARRAGARRHQAQLRERERRLSTALWGSGDEFWDADLRAGRLYRMSAHDAVSDGRERVLRLDDWTNYMVHPDDLARMQRALTEHLSGASDHFEAEIRVRDDAGTWTWTLARGRVVERDAEQQPLRLAGTARDITRLRNEERDRRIATEVIHNMTEAVTVTDLDFRFCSVNPAFTRMTGYGEDEILGTDARLLNCPSQGAEVYQRLRQDAARHGHWRGELWQRRKDGGEFLCWAEISEVRDASGVRSHYVAVLTDITDRKRAEQELRYLANYDMLTGLPNRTLLGERLSDAILRARRGQHMVAVLYIDLDRFKHVNDSMGHSTGDRLLKAAGLRLRQCVREHDTVARIGGDEFTLVLEHVASREQVAETCRRILDAFVAPLLLDTRQEVLISPSIGVALYPEHGQIPNDLIKHADTAMYQAKEQGRNTWMLYTQAMDSAARLRATMAGALRRALARDELSLVYQPKLSLGDDCVIGVEALLRWHNDRLGDVPPGVFIPLAEETGMIVEIGDFVLHRACADLRRWRDAGIGELSMAVNLSMAQLQRAELPAELRAILARHGIPPRCLELELTESMVMGNIEQSMRTLSELKAIGITVAIDDFGTGYSSLAYLKRLPLDVLKIDQTFIEDITVDPDDEAIIATIVTMAHSLGLNVVAEGVESADQIDYLRGHDCDVIQGNLLSVPLRADACLAFCMARTRRPGHGRDSHAAGLLP